MRFYKLHGLGNDYILLDAMRSPLQIERLDEFARKACSRHFGIGADGVLIAMPPVSKDAQIRMRIINPDGSEAEMCGNGIRCLAKWAYEHGKVRKQRVMHIETLAGIKTARVSVQGGRVISIEVNMGVPSLRRSDIPMRGEKQFAIDEEIEVDKDVIKVTALSMGNPHCVIFVEDVASVPVEVLGPKIEFHSAFPNRTNVEFVQVVSNDRLKVRVWERGAGATLACGTGACASLVASAATGRTGRRATVYLPGGSLEVRWSEDGQVYMKGPAEEVFEGVINDAWLNAALSK
ncbi:MAG: diaminopimelate epimerase [Armatimonadetes bacterium]|nr:diaminopimelate epimerase [Armatimonadota bacterium]MCX7778092.1 diaminopimelate epimerase [Armatimonadota bacterium]